MDEIQFASERDMAIRIVDRETTLLREVEAALHRVNDGSFGTCLDCESAISVKRLVALPWASRCIRCEDVADENLEPLVHAA
jgi:DnaK suppressor protein